jgi:ribonuclease HI
MKKAKIYVVWIGNKPGIYDNWPDCHSQVDKFPGARYKAFNTRIEAAEAFKIEPSPIVHPTSVKKNALTPIPLFTKNPVRDAIAVDGAWNNVTGKAEYRGVDIASGEEIFHQGPFDDGTNNIVEFLAIVHGLAHCKKNNLLLPIYSDSRNAISWVIDKQARTNHSQNEKNAKLFELIDRAIKWLNENEYPNELLKWETKSWGENPADFGRK